MAIFTLSEIEEQLTAYKAALRALSTGKEYSTTDGVTLRREDLPEIRKTLEWLDRDREALTSTTGRIHRNVGMVRR